MTNLRLSIATSDYDHFRDFRAGDVRAQGIDPIWLTLGHHEIFARFAGASEWDVSEMGFAKFIAHMTRDEPNVIGLPVFSSRLFRFASFYVNSRSGIRSVEDLVGKRVGSPEWAHTAAVYMRGWLHNDMGVTLQDVHWHQAGANAPGRAEKVDIALPPGVRLTRLADKSLTQLLASGEIDCVIMAHPPACFLEGHPDVVRLFPDYVDRDEQYYRDTGVWPIMHLIAMQRHLLEDNPWIARNLYDAFNESKRRSVARLLDPGVSRYPLAWLPDHGRRMLDIFGEDPFPFGIEPNRATIEALLLYAYQQGIARRHLAPADLFPADIMTKVVV